MDCYSARTADERPVRFRLEDCQYMVEEVLDQWYGPQDAFYKVTRGRRQSLYPAPGNIGA